MVQLFVPTFQIEECLAEIRDCLEKGWTGLGYKTLEFERKWLEYSGLPHAHFLNSATSGLHLVLNIFKECDGWRDGDEVITTPLTFVSTNHAILYERLTPVFADVDEYLCLSPAAIERAITPATRAVMFVGMGGSTGQLDAVKDLCKRRGLRLILDAAHMAGTRLHGRTPVADAVVFSFHAVKPLPTADAGMVCFEEQRFDELARKKSWLGINKDTYARSSERGGYQWQYDVESVGFKYHGNSIMAAIALVQLRYLDQDIAHRRKLSGWYDERFAGNRVVGTIPQVAGCESARHLYQIHVSNRDKVFLALNERDIFPGVHYRDNREYRMYRTAGAEDRCPNATRMSRRLLSLPLHLRLSRTGRRLRAGACRVMAPSARQSQLIARLKSADQDDAALAIQNADGVTIGRLVPVTSASAADRDIVEALCRWRADHATAFFTVFESNPENTRSYLRNISLADPARILFLIEDAQRRLAGNIGVCNVTPASAEIDNVLRGERTGESQFMSFACGTLLRWCFDDLGVGSVHLYVISDNARAIRLYLSLGFRLTDRRPLFKMMIAGGYRLTAERPEGAFPTVLESIRMELDPSEFRGRFRSSPDLK